MGTDNHKELHGMEQFGISTPMEEKRFKYLFDLYVKHQEEFQEVFNIVTTIGLGRAL